jgi:hypothetical protein
VLAAAQSAADTCRSNSLRRIDALQYIVEMTADGCVAFTGERAKHIAFSGADAPAARLDDTPLPEIVDDAAEIAAADTQP